MAQAGPEKAVHLSSRDMLLPNFSAKMSDVSEHSDSGGNMILLTVFMAYGPSAARSVRHDRGPNIFPSGPT